jgi:hypothetical protein
MALLELYGNCKELGYCGLGATPYAVRRRYRALAAGLDAHRLV